MEEITEREAIVLLRCLGKDADGELTPKQILIAIDLSHWDDGLITSSRDDGGVVYTTNDKGVVALLAYISKTHGGK
jgi:hypothetical protein